MDVFEVCESEVIHSFKLNSEFIKELEKKLRPKLKPVLRIYLLLTCLIQLLRPSSHDDQLISGSIPSLSSIGVKSSKKSKILKGKS